MIHNVYCMGTKNNANDRTELLPHVYLDYDMSAAYQKHIVDGPGSKRFKGFEAPANAPLQLTTDATPSKLRGIVWGKGWGSNVKRVLTALKEADEQHRITKVNLIGHSRGAVTCHMIAHAINHVFEGRVGCNIFAFDPVPGGVFDFSAWWELDAADRATLGLDGKTPEVLPPNVEHYFGILMEVEKRVFFGVLGPNRLRFESGITPMHVPLFGEHSDCVMSYLPRFPASRIALSLLLEQFEKWGVPFLAQAKLTTAQYVEEYSRLHKMALVAKANPKDIANCHPLTVAMGTLISIPVITTIGFASSYWRNRRADDITNEMRDHIFFMNKHHRDCWASEFLCQELGRGKDQDGWVSRLLAKKFKAAYPESYIMLVRLGMMRNLEAAADEVDLKDPGTKFIDVPPRRQELQSLASQITIQGVNPNGGSKYGIFDLVGWRSASYVSIGARRDQVAEIDRLLPLYHSAVTDRNPARAQRLLYRIGMQVESHLRTKRTSDRRRAMQELGRQVASKLGRLG
jgi:hypothetical protein